MLNGLFGADTPLAVKFVLAFLIVLGLIFAAFWAVRRFGAGRLGGDAMRGRQPRLSVTEQAFMRDGRRQLILVRRDNVEHLVLIGGPTDVVIETNIVRAVAAPRDVAVARPAPLEPLPRAIPLPDNGNGSWPLQPESMTPPPPAARPAPKIEPVADEPPAWPLQPQAETTPPRPQRDTLSALADELSARPTPPSPPPPLPAARNRPLGAPRGLEPRAERGEPRLEPRAEPRIPAAPQAPAAADTAAADQSLAEMAHRLEAALRKPNAPAEARTPAPAPSRPAPAAEQAAAPEPAAPAAPPPPMPRAARPQAEPKQPPRGSAPAKPPQPAQGSTLYDNLEQEMASLLGRPTNKN
jgi:flagellar protein FliO/FliZ